MTNARKVVGAIHFTFLTPDSHPARLEVKKIPATYWLAQGDCLTT